MNKVWNFGDVNLIDGGMVVVSDDYGYYVYTCNICYDRHDYYLTSDYIFADELTDTESWINRNDVTSFCGRDDVKSFCDYPLLDVFEYCTDDDERAEVMARYAADVIAYYGTQSMESERLTEDEARKRMKEYKNI